MHVKPNTLYIKTLVDIVAYDKPGNKFRLTLIYILLSLEPVKMSLVEEKILNKSDKSPVADGG